MDTCDNCGKTIRFYQSTYDPEEIYRLAFLYKFSLNDKYPDNRFVGKKFCEKCCKMLYTSVPDPVPQEICPICNEKFFTREEMLKHYYSHDICPACGQTLKVIGLGTAKGWLSWSEFFTKYCDNPECVRYKLKVM